MPTPPTVSQELGLVSGQHIINYILDEEIGSGGMGAVWRARHQHLQRHDAVKFIRKRVSTAWLDRFRQEAVAAARVKHQNVVTVYDAFTWSTDERGRDMFAIAMELMSGKSLDNDLPKNLHSALNLFLQIVQGLIAIHGEHIIHRDLKPQNVFIETFLGPMGQSQQLAKIGDFGIAQLPNAPLGVKTSVGAVFGSMLYAPPEQIRDTSATDERSDLYSLGLIFWQVLTQTLNFPQSYAYIADNDELIAAKQQLPEEPSLLNPSWNIPPQLDDLVLTLLQPDPEKRYQTAQEVYQHLSIIQTTLTQPTVNLPTTPPSEDGQLTFDDLKHPYRDDAPTVLSVTDVMRSRSVDTVRRLFAKLGYPITPDPFIIDPSAWYAQSRSAIEAAFWVTNYNLGGDAFGVVLFELNDLSAATLQSISRDLLRRGGNWLFVAAKTARSPVDQPVYERLLFVLPQRGATPDRPRLLRLAVDIARPTRHTLNVLRDMALREPLPPPAAIYTQLLDAFNIEVITKHFYRQYAKLFRELVTAVRTDNVMIAEFGDVREVEGFVQRLLGRLMFLSFLQKKGWLAGDEAFLTSQFGIVTGNLGNYYRDFLVPLFFRALALPENERNTNPAVGPVWNQTEVPFLNGGLFEVGIEQDYELDTRSSGASGVYFDNRYFAPDDTGPFDIGSSEHGGILAFFNRYDFTVEEDTPEDIAVSLDPEMLGKVFEELITERHETGSYYTPRPVVGFMCHEALKGLLQSRLPRIDPAALAKLVDEHDATDLSRPTRTDVIAELRSITICDPACGSGAYLLGMLHELLALRQLLVRGDDDARSVYDEKLDIIERNIYGVDADPIAVSIARLRLWLSLIVDFNGDNPPPLPNLDYKIMIGDSLVETINGKPLVPDTLAIDYVYDADRELLQKEFQSLREQLFSYSGTTDQRRHIKEQLLDKEQSLILSVLQGEREKIDEKERIILASKDWQIIAKQKSYKRGLDSVNQQRNIIKEIERQVSKEQRRPIFPWNLYFSEVFHRGGFDIMLANPPYVRAGVQYRYLTNEIERQEAIARWNSYRRMLEDSGDYETLYEKWDLFIPFLERAFQKLRSNGQMIFIISDSYNAAKYAIKSQEFFLKNSQIARLDFCSDIPLFEGVGVKNTILHFAKKVAQSTYRPIRFRHWGEKANDFLLNSEQLQTEEQALSKRLTFSPTVAGVAAHFEHVVTLNEICYLSWGLRPNSDERFYRGAFKTKDVLSNVQDELHPKPCVQGKDTVKWWAYRIRYIEWNTYRAPSMFARATFPELYDVPEKILCMEVSGEDPRCVYDSAQLICTHAFCCCVPWDALKDVRNRSIRDTARYADELQGSTKKSKYYDREKLESLSQQFEVKYLIAIMNSKFAKQWLLPRRRHKIQLYPEDWKPFPIAVIPSSEQQPLVDLVDQILNEFQTHGYPLPGDAAARVALWEREIDVKVYAIYGVAPNDVAAIVAAAPTDVGETDDDDEEA